MANKKRVFISFDYDHDEGAKIMLAGQAKLSDSPFDFKDSSVKEHLTGDWKDKVRRRAKHNHDFNRRSNWVLLPHCNRWARTVVDSAYSCFTIDHEYHELTYNTVLRVCDDCTMLSNALLDSSARSTPDTPGSLLEVVIPIVLPVIKPAVQLESVRVCDRLELDSPSRRARTTSWC